MPAYTYNILMPHATCLPTRLLHLCPLPHAYLIYSHSTCAAYHIPTYTYTAIMQQLATCLPTRKLNVFHMPIYTYIGMCTYSIVPHGTCLPTSILHLCRMYTSLFSRLTNNKPVVIIFIYFRSQFKWILFVIYVS